MQGPVQATGHLKASSAHQKICECMLCPLVFFGTINDEDCDLQGPSLVAGWLAGWLAGHHFRPFCGLVASRHSEFACHWHVHSTADTLNKNSVSSMLVSARTHSKLMWLNGPMVAVGHVHHNNKSIHCLNHSGGDNHPERVVHCGSHASLIEHHLCWHSDPSLD